MINQLINLILLTFIPFVELRLSIPVGILEGSINLPFNIVLSGMGLNPLFVFLLVSISNIALGVALFNILVYADKGLRKSLVKKHYSRFMDRSHRKLRPYVEKYGILGVSIFIGIPLPGSGVYMGSLGAFMLGLKKREFYLATTIGVLLASSIVTLLTLTGMRIF